MEFNSEFGSTVLVFLPFCTHCLLVTMESFFHKAIKYINAFTREQEREKHVFCLPVWPLLGAVMSTAGPKYALCLLRKSARNISEPKWP